MADSKITGLSADTTPTTDDLIVTVNDPGGTPANKKVTLGDVRTLLALRTKIITITRDVSTASGDVAYTGAGFTPTGLIAVGAISSTLSFMIGVADSSKAGSQIESYANNTMQETDTAFLNIATSAGVNQTATVKTYDADGFTLTWTKSGSPTGSATFAVLCIR